MDNQKKRILTYGIVSVAAIGTFFVVRNMVKDTKPIAPPIPPEKIEEVVPKLVQPIVEEVPVQEAVQTNELYTTITIQTTNPQKELDEAFGKANIAAILQINRIDIKNVRQNAVLTVPKSFENYMALSPLPSRIEQAQQIPKLFIIDQTIQAFGAYEYGTLVRWGGVSTGKKATQTKNGVYFTNWKGKEVVSSFSDEWILKWNFNIDNFNGIGLHQYEMPGYPASHSCVRLFEDDAKWFYEWADQWIVSSDDQTILAHGTPVILTGQYAYGTTAPWKKLATDATATTVSVDEIEKLVEGYKEKIIVKVQERATYEASKEGR